MRKFAFGQIAALVGMIISVGLSGCGSIPGPGPYNGLNTGDKGAVTKIGCFRYTEEIPIHPVLTAMDVKACTEQAIKCQRQQNWQASNLGETMLANGAVSAGVGAAQFRQEAKALNIAKSVAGKYPGLGATLGALGSINPSLLVYSSAEDGTVGACARDFLADFKRKWREAHENTLEAGRFDDLHVETEYVRANPYGNVDHSQH